jgi:hypothetical protein
MAKHKLTEEDMEDLREGARNLAFRMLFDEAERLREVKPGEKLKQRHRLLAEELENIARFILRPAGGSL